MPDSRDITLSKSLSRILRHKAKDENLTITRDGFVRVSDILELPYFKGIYTVDDIKRVVFTNDKQRFSLRSSNGILEICANQGHSIPDINKLSLTPILETQLFDVIHGTYFKNWEQIKTGGLSCMKRNHIHFAKGLPVDRSVISGMRRNCQVYIYINLELALTDGIKFYMSRNEVILSPGDEKGIIKPKYFLKVYDIYGKSLL